MLVLLARSWWTLLIRGLAAILFGILALVWPELTLAVLVLFFGAYALVDGVFNVVAAFRRRQKGEDWWLVLLGGVASILFGVLTLTWPEITALVLLYFIAAWALVTGAFEIAAAIALRRQLRGEWMLALSGLASVVFGGLMFAFPGAGAVAVAWIIGVYAIFFGALTVALSLRLRRLLRERGEEALIAA